MTIDRDKTDKLTDDLERVIHRAVWGERLECYTAEVFNKMTNDIAQAVREHLEKGGYGRITCLGCSKIPSKCKCSPGGRL